MDAIQIWSPKWLQPHAQAHKRRICVLKGLNFEEILNANKFLVWLLSLRFLIGSQQHCDMMRHKGEEADEWGLKSRSRHPLRRAFHPHIPWLEVCSTLLLRSLCDWCYVILDRSNMNTLLLTQVVMQKKKKNSEVACLDRKKSQIFNTCKNYWLGSFYSEKLNPRTSQKGLVL